MKSLTGGGEMVTGIEIATEIGTNVVAGEWTMIKTVTTLVVIEIPDTEVEVDREKDIIGMKIIIDVIIEIKEIAIIEVPAIKIVAGTAREAEVTSNFS